MAKLADAADLKSAGPKGLWGFDSPSRHQLADYRRLLYMCRRERNVSFRRGDASAGMKMRKSRCERARGYFSMCASNFRKQAIGTLLSGRVRCRGGLDPIPTTTLRSVEGFVGTAQEHFAVRSSRLTLLHGREPEAERD